jgi:hypothetical protein
MLASVASAAAGDLGCKPRTIGAGAIASPKHDSEKTLAANRKKPPV